MRMILGLLPGAGLLLLVVAARRAGSQWMVAFARASVLWGVLIVGTTEVLSLAGWFATGPLAAAWVAIIAVVITRIPRQSAKRREASAGAPPEPLPGVLSASVFALAGIAIILALTAVLAPPNTWDVLTYHMSRVVRWLENRSVAHFATGITRQLYQAPFAEFAIAQLMGLTGSDRLVNLVAWYSWAATAIVAALVARQLGASRSGQVLAAVFWATVPMGILQATSSKNDVVATLWLLCFVHFGIRLISPREAGDVAVAGRAGKYDDALMAGAALGLAILTKPTNYLFAAPYVTFVGLALLARRKAPRHVAVLAACALALNLGHFWRNTQLWGWPLGPRGADATEHYTNSRLGAGVIVSNMLRNVAVHAGLPSDRATAGIESLVRRVHGRLGLDADDPATTWEFTRFSVPRMSRGDENAGNPLHLATIVLALGLGVLLGRRRGWSAVHLLAAGALVSAFLFAMMLKWQPWQSRLHLPLFGLFAPVVGATLASVRRRDLTAPASVVLIVAAIPWTLDNWSRRLLPLDRWVIPRPTESQLIGSPRLAVYPALARFAPAADEIRRLHCTDVGLMAPTETPEYLLWVLLRESGEPVRLRHVGIRNRSARLQPAIEPCAVLCARCGGAVTTIDGRAYSVIQTSEDIDVLLPRRDSR